MSNMKTNIPTLLLVIVSFVAGLFFNYVATESYNPWICTDACVVEMNNVENKSFTFQGVIKIYKRKNTEEYKAEWGHPEHLKELDFEFAKASFEVVTGRKPNLQIK